MHLITSSVVFFSAIFLMRASTKRVADCNLNVRLTQKLQNEGYHRNITYTINGLLKSVDDSDTRDSWQQRQCMVVVEQGLPPGIFVNPDELGELRRTRKLNAITRNPISVELPAEVCESNTVHVIKRVLSSRVKLWLPVHARYHKARVGGGAARNNIENPKVFLRCLNYSLEDCDSTLYQKTAIMCSEIPNGECIWRNIPYNIMKSETLVWYVPVGNLDHYYLVSTVTAVVIIVSSLFLIKTIHNHKIKLKLK